MNALVKNFLPVTQNPNNLPAAPSEDIMARLAGTLGAAMVDLSSGGFTRITFGGRAFTVQEGGAKTQLLHNGAPATFMDFVILNVSADRHLVWYEKIYDPRSAEPAGPPTAVWWSKDAPPAEVPDWVMNTKKNTNGLETNHYQTCQRVVGILMKQTDNGYVLDTEKIYVLDFTGMSIYGKDQPPAYTFKGLMQYCHNSGFLPLTFPIRATFTSDSVPVLRFHPFMNQNTGKPAFFSDDLTRALCDLAVSKEVVDLLDAVKTSKPPTQGGAAANPAPAPYQEPAAAYTAPVTAAAPVVTPPVQEPVAAAPNMTIVPAADTYANANAAPDLTQAATAAAQSAQATLGQPASADEPLSDDDVMKAMEALAAR